VNHTAGCSRVVRCQGILQGVYFVQPSRYGGLRFGWPRVETVGQASGGGRRGEVLCIGFLEDLDRGEGGAWVSWMVRVGQEGSRGKVPLRRLIMLRLHLCGVGDADLLVRFKMISE